MSLTEAQKTEVRAAMEKYATAYRNKDINALNALFSPTISGFGSGPDEVIRNHKEFVRQISRDLSQATGIALVFSDTVISGEGPVAWVMTRCSFSFTLAGSGQQTLNGRITMVLRNTGSRWLIEQIHFSMPFEEQATGQSFPGA